MPPVEKHDTIRAYVFKGEEVHEKDVNDPFGLQNNTWGKKQCYNPTPPSHYVERDLQKKEEVVKIEKIRNDEVVATYRSSPPTVPAPHHCDDHGIIGSD